MPRSLRVSTVDEFLTSRKPETRANYADELEVRWWFNWFCCCILYSATSWGRPNLTEPRPRLPVLLSLSLYLSFVFPCVLSFTALRREDRCTKLLDDAFPLLANGPPEVNAPDNAPAFAVISLEYSVQEFTQNHYE